MPDEHYIAIVHSNPMLTSVHGSETFSHSFSNCYCVPYY